MPSLKPMPSRRGLLRLLTALAAVGLAGTGPARASRVPTDPTDPADLASSADPVGHAGRANPTGSTKPTDPWSQGAVPLVTRDGVAVDWRRDVLGSRIVIANFVYTSCASICLPGSALMAQVQSQLAERGGTDRERGSTDTDAGLALVSISVDPLTDTPERLEAFARPFEPGPLWWWLTGRANDVYGLLDRLGVGSGGDPQAHQPVWLIGGADRGAWQRLLGFPDPRQLIEIALALKERRSRSVTPARHTPT